MRLPESPAIGPHTPAGIADDKRGKPEVVLPRAAVEDNLPRRRQPRVCECRSGGAPSGTGTVEGQRSCARSRARVCFPVRGGGLATPTPTATAVTTTTAMVTATMTTTAHGGAAYVRTWRSGEAPEDARRRPALALRFHGRAVALPPPACWRPHAWLRQHARCPMTSFPIIKIGTLIG